jgi:hypothetical protein
MIGRALWICTGLCAAATLLMVGCSGSAGTASVNGMVTLDGQPLEKGTITFTCLEGAGGNCAGVITGGQYSVDNVVAGKNRVEIKAETSAASGSKLSYEESMRRSEEMRKLAEAAKKKTVDRADVKKKVHQLHNSLVTPETIGNNQVMEISLGRQTKDVSLMTPRR